LEQNDLKDINGYLGVEQAPQITGHVQTWLRF